MNKLTRYTIARCLIGGGLFAAMIGYYAYWVVS